MARPAASTWVRAGTAGTVRAPGNPRAAAVLLLHRLLLLLLQPRLQLPRGRHPSSVRVRPGRDQTQVEAPDQDRGDTSDRRSSGWAIGHRDHQLHCSGRRHSTDPRRSFRRYQNIASGAAAAAMIVSSISWEEDRSTYAATTTLVVCVHGLK